MKALLYEAREKVSLRTLTPPVIEPDEALIRVEACGLCGTDLVKIFNGHMTPPVPLGHEVSGRIVQAGRRVRGFKSGDRVIVAHHVPCFHCHYCDHGNHSMCRQFKTVNIEPGGFSQMVRVSGKHLKHTVLKIPPKLDFLTACQTEPLACCLRNARRLGLHVGDIAVVVGLGSIGLLMAQVLVQRKVIVIGVDIDAQRAAIARESGIDHAFVGRSPDLEKLVSDLSQNRGVDAVVFTAGTPALATEYIPLLRDGGAINIFASFHPQSNMTLDLNAVYYRELTLTSSYSAAPEDLKEALRLLTHKEIKMTAHTRHAFPLERFEEAFAQVRQRRILKAILLPQKEP